MFANIVQYNVSCSLTSKNKGQFLCPLWLFHHRCDIIQELKMTAWCEQEGVRQAIQTKFPSIKVYYIEEEPGCDVYYTNDNSGDFFPEKYLLDGEEVYEYFETIEEVSEFVNERFGLTTTPDLEEIERKINEYVEGQEDEDFYLNLHEFRYVEG